MTGPSKQDGHDLDVRPLGPRVAQLADPHIKALIHEAHLGILRPGQGAVAFRGRTVPIPVGLNAFRNWESRFKPKSDKVGATRVTKGFKELNEAAAKSSGIRKGALSYIRSMKWED